MSTAVKDPGTFFQYMMGFVGQDTPKGDLARDMKRDAEYSCFNEVEEIRTFEELICHLEWNIACRECIATARKCWRDYMRAVRKWENETGKESAFVWQEPYQWFGEYDERRGS